MVRFGRFVLAVVATAVVSLGNDVNAGVIYDNTTLASNGYVEASVDGPLFNSFSTGGTGFLLTDVKLVLASTNVSSGKSFTVSLVANNANKPGTVLNSLATINDSSLSVAGSTIDVSVSSIALTANTRYWIEVNGAGGIICGMELWRRRHRHGCSRRILGIQSRRNAYGYSERFYEHAVSDAGDSDCGFVRS